MNTLAVEAVGAVTERPKTRLSFSRNSAELILVALLALTAAIICFQHQIFGRDIVVDDHTANRFIYSGYADQVSGGRSTITLSPRPLSWTCDIRTGASSLYCGYEIVFDGNGAAPGLDLRTLDKVTLTLDYQGPGTTLRFYLKNEDPRYSKHGDRSTTKINKVEFTVHPGRQTVVFRPSDFSVADWWLAGKHFAPEMGHTQIDDVVAAEVSSASVAPPGHYSLRVRSMTLTRSDVAPAELYLAILAAWALIIGLYMAIRVRRARRDALEKEQAQAEVRAALASAKLAAERASQAKSDFLASMSHELRTPLNAVLGYAQLLERAKLSEKHLAAVRTIHRSGAHLLSLITDILDLSKIEAGKMELHSAPTNLRSAIGSVVEMISVRAEQKGLVFTCEIADEVPEAVEADEKRLRQVLLNLLSNAVKFTADGRVSLTVSLLERTDETARLRFEVQDSGPGIAEDQLEQIFRPFEQVGEIQRRDGGTGLGLTISRQLATLMGSNIEVQSRLGHGALFWFDAAFPLAVAPAAQAADAAEIRGYAGRRRKVLVVDDHPTNRELLCDLLEPLGFTTEVACDGREAVRLAQLVAPDLILMDLTMPVMDGAEAIRLIRMIEPLKGVAILAVSANNPEDGQAGTSLAGADGFISKPIDNCELLSAIGPLLGLKWITATNAASDAGRSEDAEPTCDEISPERPLRVLAAEDNPVNQQVLRALLQGFEVELEIVGDGAAAVRAVADSAFDLVLMDVEMPGMGGLEAARAIRRAEAKAAGARTLIVALSANDGPEHVAEYRAAGMDAHLEKPIDIEQLFKLLQQVSAGVPAEVQLTA